MNANKNNYMGNSMIIVATIIWGAGYAAQSAGMDHVSPLTFNAARFLIGGLMALLPALFFLRRQNKVLTRASDASKGISSKTVFAGLICGAVLCLAINLQQFGLMYTTVANASFITSLYVIMVPFVCLILFKKRVSPFTWVGVGVAMSGIYFLSFSGGMSVNLGDVLVFFCAVAFTAQILIISHFSPKHNVVALACVQFFTVFVISLGLAFVFETPAVADLTAAAPYVLYTGVLSSGVAYILQMKAQKTTDPTVTAVLFSFEAVVASIVGWLVLSQSLNTREIVGCTLIFAAIVFAQLKTKNK